MPRADRVFLPNKLKLKFPRAVILRHAPQEKVEFPPFPILHLVHGQVS